MQAAVSLQLRVQLNSRWKIRHRCAGAVTELVAEFPFFAIAAAHGRSGNSVHFNWSR